MQSCSCVRATCNALCLITAFCLFNVTAWLCHAQDNGLKLANSWKGYYALLNPEYSQQILWRFVS